MFLQNLQALMNECIGHVIGKPHSPVTGLYIGKMLLWDRELLRVWSSGLISVYVLLQLYKLGVTGTYFYTKQARERCNNSSVAVKKQKAYV